ncbi:hypothetical protein TUM4249_28020 [Shewanella sp. KT0246]|nr:hypothetical protein TUM4249_28020 [Shewanella sp. KT0246]
MLLRWKYFTSHQKSQGLKKDVSKKIGLPVIEMKYAIHHNYVFKGKGSLAYTYDNFFYLSYVYFI